MPFAATGMDLEYHTKWGKSERGRQTLYDITYMWNIKYDTNELFSKTQNRLTDIENRLVFAKGVGKKRIESLGLADTNYYI